MIYRLAGGFQVRTTRHAERTEFETLNPSGEVISVVVKEGTEAASLIQSLFAEDIERFSRVCRDGRPRS
ncbi:hypothetical protein [Allostreptomyces psammosilenae]|uniref:Uncharacterized protein n=1 Tax=Allostreptomyces psammosilenae TaxID=1892865 RepID=A0A852ZZH4_9ACTN|nr:hypothetical protein [Allostreptomyces psammosilenae]NYI06094.1 hypothetical protein [Allostreptomyces psammosilenae]